jgi:hypothetical protein
MSGRGNGELLEMLRELTTLQRENARRLSRVEKCLALVSAALPSLAADLRNAAQSDAVALAIDPADLLTGEEQRTYLEQASEALEFDDIDDPGRRKFLDS